MWSSLGYYSPLIGGIAVAGLVCAAEYPKMWGLERSRKALANYVGDKEEPIEENLNFLSGLVIHDSSYTEDDEMRLNLFTCRSTEPLHKGSIYMKTGALIGIPYTYAYKTTNDVNRSLFSIATGSEVKAIDWKSEAGKEFLDSLVMSDKGKMFGIARELAYADTASVHVDGAMVMTFGVFGVGGMIFNQRFFSRRAPKAFILGGHVVIGTLCAALYFLLRDSYFCWRDRKVDYRAAKIGLPYAEGGVEFYSKILQRNKALRHLLGSEGASKYTAYGNEIHTWTEPHVKYTSRLDIVKAVLDKIIEEGPKPIKPTPDLKIGQFKIFKD